MLTRNLLIYYQGPGFAAEYSTRANTDYEAACSQLRAIIDELMAAGRALLYPSAENLKLSQLVNGPLSVKQLVALARKYAIRLLRLIC